MWCLGLGVSQKQILRQRCGDKSRVWEMLPGGRENGKIRQWRKTTPESVNKITALGNQGPQRDGVDCFLPLLVQDAPGTSSLSWNSLVSQSALRQQGPGAWSGLPSVCEWPVHGSCWWPRGCGWSRSPDMQECTPFKKVLLGRSHRGSAERNRTGIHEDTGLIPGLAPRVKDPALLWAVV